MLPTLFTQYMKYFLSHDGETSLAFDVVFALIRCGLLLPTDTFWIDGMGGWKPLSEATPLSPSHTKPATLSLTHSL